MSDRHPALPVLSGVAAAPSSLRAGAHSGAGSSILDRRITLAELLDIRSFRDVCASFVDLYKIGIKIFDVSDNKLVDIRVGNGDWCGYIFANPSGRRMCTDLVTRIKRAPYAELDRGQVVEQRCFSGLKYVLMPITYGGDVLGRVVYGPFVPAELTAPGAAVEEFGGGFESEQLWAYRSSLRRAPDDTVARILTNFRQVIETIIAIAYKALMTQHLHLESITASYHELYSTNQALKQSVAQLEELDRMKASFVAMISHELRTPLTSIIGYSEMLLEGLASAPLDEAQRGFVSTIMEKGEVLLEMIRSILDLSKIEAGAVQLDRAPLDLAEIIAAAQRTVVPDAQKKNVTLVVEVPGDLPQLVGDRDKIGQAIVNLLANAVKFTPADGRITIRARRFHGQRRFSADVNARFGPEDEDFVRVDIEDTGIGIPADQLGQVFDAFHQVQSTFTREFGGSGLGLAIVKSFVEAHGGEVWVESAEQQGTTFSLLFPLRLPSPEAEQLVAPIPAARSSRPPG